MKPGFFPLQRLPRMHSTAVNVAVVLAALYVVCATEEHHKRAPSGFTGVRGKKSIPDAAYAESGPESEASDAGAVDKRAPSGFMGMRGKKPYPVWEGVYPDGAFKRAPSGFMGMRGKKEYEVAGYGDDYIKRAPSMGFMGMRGKKEYDYLPADYDTYYEKRAPSMGFVGMRGKKEDDLVEDKRAPSGFFGMRGKKQPNRQSGFFGMRGKKYPYEFRGKFVGVRGKKTSNEVTEPDYYNGLDASNLKQELDLNQMMLLLTKNEAEANQGWDGANDVNVEQYSQK